MAVGSSFNTAASLAAFAAPLQFVRETIACVTREYSETAQPFTEQRNGSSWSAAWVPASALARLFCFADEALYEVRKGLQTSRALVS